MQDALISANLSQIIISRLASLRTGRRLTASPAAARLVCLVSTPAQSSPDKLVSRDARDCALAVYKCVWSCGDQDV